MTSNNCPHTLCSWPLFITFTRGINNKYPKQNWAIPCEIWAKLHSLPFPRISPNTTRLRLMVFGLILWNGNLCNFLKIPLRPISNPPKTPRPRLGSIWEIWNGSSGYFFQISLELNFARVISHRKTLPTWNIWINYSKIHLWVSGVYTKTLQMCQANNLHYLHAGISKVNIIL